MKTTTKEYRIAWKQINKNKIENETKKKNPNKTLIALLNLHSIIADDEEFLKRRKFTLSDISNSPFVVEAWFRGA